MECVCVHATRSEAALYKIQGTRASQYPSTMGSQPIVFCITSENNALYQPYNEVIAR